MKPALALAASLVLAVSAYLVVRQFLPQIPPQKEQRLGVTAEGQTVVSGTLICIGCEMEREGVEVICHQAGLRTAEGTVFSLYPAKEMESSKELLEIHSYAGAQVQAAGSRLSDANILAVQALTLI